MSACSRALVFDLDGTLLDSVPDLHAAACKLLAGEGVQPVSPKVTRSFVGHGVVHLVASLARARSLPFGEDDLKRLTQTFLEHYRRAPADRSRLYPDVPEVLRELYNGGYGLGLCTNKPEQVSREILKAYAIEEFFDSIVGGDTLAKRKPDPTPLLYVAEQLGASQVLYVGDSEVDSQTAKAAGLPFALFTEGYRSSSIKELPHSFAFSNYSELLSFDWNSIAEQDSLKRLVTL